MKLDTGVVPVDEQTYHAIATSRGPRADEGMKGLLLAMSSNKAVRCLYRVPRECRRSSWRHVLLDQLLHESSLALGDAGYFLRPHRV